MVIATITPRLDQPRISSNQLGEFTYGTPALKLRILRDQKFGNPFSSPYYQPALDAILQSFNGLSYDREILAEARRRVNARWTTSPRQVWRWKNNSEMIRRFSEIADAASPPAGRHLIVRRNALIELEGVMVSVRPEIITSRPQSGLFSYTKLRFSKSKVAEDSAEIILLLLLKFGQQKSYETSQLDPDNTRLIDCFGQKIVAGGAVGRIREQQLQEALKEIRWLWPSLHPAPQRTEPSVRIQT